MIMINGQLYISKQEGVLIFHPSKRFESFRFINNSWYDKEKLEAILGLDKPKPRIKALTGLWNSPFNCHVVHKPKFKIA